LLKATPDGDGTLLETTLVVYLSEISHGNHGHEFYHRCCSEAAAVS